MKRTFIGLFLLLISGVIFGVMFPSTVRADSVQVFCGGTPVSGIRTAIGCIQASDTRALINQAISWAMKIIAGILILNIAYAGLMFTTAAGDPERVTDSKQLLSASLLGLAIIALAVLILNLVGVHILGLNLFGFQV